jgi:hypothetical protein
VSDDHEIAVQRALAELDAAETVEAKARAGKRLVQAYRARATAADPPPAPRTYSVGVAGESNYQDAIRACSVGQLVDVVHETGNPYDDQALAVVVAASGTLIGYIPRESWLRQAIHDEGKGCDAIILSIEGPEHRRGVVLQVSLNHEGVVACAYSGRGIA